MSITTVAVTFFAADQNGDPLVGARVTATLDKTEIEDGFVVPETVEVTAGPDGLCVLNLWPNALGVAGSAYQVRAWNPDTGKRFLDARVVVPNSACRLEDILVQEPYPSIDAAQQALIAAQGALAPVVAARDIAITKAAEALASANASQVSRLASGASASEAAGSASTATARASDSQAYAGDALAARNVASGAATTATNRAAAALASEQASEASRSASVVSAAAALASASASEASRLASEASAGAASTSAASAQGAVNTATAQAQSATTSATNAAASAATAVTQATNAGASSATAATLASDANTSAISASSSASAANTSATTATTKAAEAVASRDAAAASASAASTSASNAAADRALAVQSAAAATTGAAIATTRVGEITASAATANAKAGEAAGSAAQALSIYGTAAAQQTAIATAAAQASLAAGYALSAASVAQQDLSGVTAAALHRSPNAVTAMTVYDTSKDSDGGAWTERCQGTSWYNEPLMGKWLGAEVSELYARQAGATLGPELVGDPELNNPAYWVVGIYAPVNFTLTNGQAIRQNNANGASIPAPVNLLAGRTYRIRVGLTSTRPTIAAANSSNYGFISVNAAISGQAANVTSPTKLGNPGSAVDFYITPTVNTNMLTIYSNTNSYTDIESVSCKEVTATTTQSGDYFQLATDGKFYRLWKNLINRSSTFGGFGNSGSSVALTPVVASGPSGGTSYKLVPTASAATVGGIDTVWFGVAVAGTRYSFSIKAKAGEYPRIGVRGMYSPTTGYMFHGTIDLTTGAVVSNTGLYPVTATQDPRGGGYYIIKVEGLVANGGANLSVTIEAHDANSVAQQQFAANGTSGIFITEPQYESGLLATTYEENPNTVTFTETFRGNKRSFPKLAGIVAEGGNSSTITIYDLAEPGRPMWMRLKGSYATESFILYDVSSIAAGQAKLLVGSLSIGLAVIDFVADSNDQFTQYTVSKKYKSNIANRNNALGFAILDGKYPAIIRNAVNAVAMTVLADAPTDPVTGLKVPTIDVFTAGGVSRIQHNGAVVSAGNVTGLHKGGQTGRKRQIQTAFDAIRVSAFLTENNGSPTFKNAGYGGSAGLVHYLGSPTPASAFAVYGNKFGVAQAFPLNFISISETAAPRSIASHISNTFNTGHLIGDIRRAYLSDVGAGSVSGSELVVNGGFDTDFTGWTIENGATVMNGQAIMTTTGSGGASAVIRQVITTVPGKTYSVSVDKAGGTGQNYTIYLYVGTSTGAIDLLYAPAWGTLSNGRYTWRFTATTTTSHIYLLNNATSSGGSITIDNVSIKESAHDRSYKAQSATVTGTLTKTPVA